MLLSSILILFCSIVQPWEINAQKDRFSAAGHSRGKQKASADDDDSNSPETVKIERIIKSSVYPYITEHDSKPFSVVSKSISPGNVNTTIRLKFIEGNPSQNIGGAVRIVPGSPSGYNIKQDEVNSDEHGTHLQTQEMSSQKIILYNKTKTHEDTSKSSKKLLQQLTNLNWPTNGENQNDLKDYSVQKEVKYSVKQMTPVAAKKQVIAGPSMDIKDKGFRFRHNENKQKVLLDDIKNYLKESDVSVTTRSPIDKRFKISEPQKRLLTLLYKLVQNREITYDFTNRLVHLFYTHGYQNQLLQVLFDFVMGSILSQGDSEGQQIYINNLLELWNVFYRLQSKTKENDSHKNEKYLPHQSSEQLQIWKLLQLIDSLRKPDIGGNNVLRSQTLNDLKSLYNTFDNKDNLLQIIFNHINKLPLNTNKPGSTKKIPPNAPEHATKDTDINGLLQIIMQQSTPGHKQNVLVEHDKMKPTKHKSLNEKPGDLPHNEQWKILFDLLPKNKKAPQHVKPKDFLFIHNVYEEVDDDDGLPIKPGTTHKPTKDKKTSSKLDGIESIDKMYQMLLELSTNNKIQNNDELWLKIIEVMNKIKSQNVDTRTENPREYQIDDRGDVKHFTDFTRDKSIPNYILPNCVVGTSWTDNCESCVCMAGNIPVCNIIPNCVFGESREEPMQCKPHSKFRLDKCNTCKCNAVGIPICTFMECKEPVILDPGTKKLLPQQDALKAILCPPEKKMPVCAPHTVWRSGCHDCVCDENGQRHCNQVKNCELLPLSKGSPRIASQTPPPRKK